MKKLSPLYLFSIAIVIFGLFGYWSLNQNGWAFPLDDAWIHQAYARNLAQNFEWAFISGQPSAGGTSFLWVLLLAIGYVFNVAPALWSTILGFVLVLACMKLAIHFQKEFSENHIFPLWLIPIAVLLEWHLLWAAYSGMETLLLAVLVLLLMTRLQRIETSSEFSFQTWLLNALILGAAIATRPDAITLFGPIGLFLVFSKLEQIRKLIAGLALILVPMLVNLPFALLNLQNSGSLLPSTFYAKQAEYSILLENSLLMRWGNMGAQVIMGIGVLLIPGFVYLIWTEIAKRRLVVPLFSTWILGYITLFAVRLPLAYQHGRYMIPVIPIFLVIGLLGSYALFERFIKAQQEFVSKHVFQGIILAVLCVYAVLGSQGLNNDVAFIEAQMSATANWVKKNLPQESRIAAHDIGAIGYFSEPQLSDLAGLVSPEVIPFIRDEELLKDYMNKNNVEFLITFPDWYPSLSANLTILYQAPSFTVGNEEVEGMSVYIWKE
jgi:hypothetical protein